MRWREGAVDARCPRTHFLPAAKPTGLVEAHLSSFFFFLIRNETGAYTVKTKVVSKFSKHSHISQKNRYSNSHMSIWSKRHKNLQKGRKTGEIRISCIFLEVAEKESSAALVGASAGVYGLCGMCVVDVVEDIVMFVAKRVRLIRKGEVGECKKHHI